LGFTRRWYLINISSSSSMLFYKLTFSNNLTWRYSRQMSSLGHIFWQSSPSPTPHTLVLQISMIIN
jgi:hypothetical protein